MKCEGEVQLIKAIISRPIKKQKLIHTCIYMICLQKDPGNDMLVL